MKMLSEKKWSAFTLEDEFNSTKGIYLPTKKVLDGEVPYVTAKSENNGVGRFIGNNVLFNGNRITIEKIHLNAYYQPAPFYGSHDISVLSNDFINENNAHFITKMIMRNSSKYSYGRQAQLNVVKRQKVMFPVTDKGTPDYDYMTQYVTSIKKNMLEHYKKFIKTQIAKLKYENIPAMEKLEWKQFSLFGDNGIVKITTTNSGIDDQKILYNSTNVIPYITRTAINNGVAKFVSSENLSYGFDHAGCIIVGLDTQTAFWQPYEFITGQNVHVITGECLNIYLAQFLIPLIKKQMSAKFNWGGNGATLGRMQRLKIMLPVKDNGIPDYEYMEQYSKNMMLHKYQQYLSYLDNK